MRLSRLRSIVATMAALSVFSTGSPAQSPLIGTWQGYWTRGGCRRVKAQSASRPRSFEPATATSR